MPNTRRTATNTRRRIPEAETPAITKESTEKKSTTEKIMMCETYISNDFILIQGNEYTIPSELASILIANHEAKKC